MLVVLSSVASRYGIGEKILFAFAARGTDDISKFTDKSLKRDETRVMKEGY
jgi:hypothetical protein